MEKLKSSCIYYSRTCCSIGYSNSIVVVAAAVVVVVVVEVVAAVVVILSSSIYSNICSS
jgi:hypothetical protein